MKKKKKEIALYGKLLCPIAIGKSALFTAGGQIYHTSRVVALHEQEDTHVHFETVNSHYHLSTSPFPAAAIRPLPVRLTACA